MLHEKSETCTERGEKKSVYEREQTPMNWSAHSLVFLALA